MTELRERVASAIIFTKLDLKDGHHLIRMEKKEMKENRFPYPIWTL